MGVEWKGVMGSQLGNLGQPTAGLAGSAGQEKTDTTMEYLQSQLQNQLQATPASGQGNLAQSSQYGQLPYINAALNSSWDGSVGLPSGFTTVAVSPGTIYWLSNSQASFKIYNLKTEFVKEPEPEPVKEADPPNKLGRLIRLEE